MAFIKDLVYGWMKGNVLYWDSKLWIGRSIVNKPERWVKEPMLAILFSNAVSIACMSCKLLSIGNKAHIMGKYFKNLNVAKD
jgi:hypothetical protein